jgi:hypothetical protein
MRLSLAVAALLAYALLRRRGTLYRHPKAAPLHPVEPTDPALTSGSCEPVGDHFLDIRRAAALYSNIVAILAGFALTALVLVITLSASDPANTSAAAAAHVDDAVAYATELLGVGFIGCLMSSFLLAAIASESLLVAYLHRSMIYVSVSISLSTAVLLGGFQVLGYAFLPRSGHLFTVLVVAVVVIASIFVPAPLVDAVRTFRPLTPSELKAPHRPRNERDALRLAGVCAAIILVPLGAGVLWYFLHEGQAPPSDPAASIYLVSALVTVVASSLLAAATTVPRKDRDGRPGFLSTAMACVAIGATTGVLVATLPS